MFELVLNSVTQQTCVVQQRSEGELVPGLAYAHRGCYALHYGSGLRGEGGARNAGIPPDILVPEELCCLERSVELQHAGAKGVPCTHWVAPRVWVT